MYKYIYICKYIYENIYKYIYVYTYICIYNYNIYVYKDVKYKIRDFDFKPSYDHWNL